MKPISYEYLHPTEHRMAHARKNIRCKKARQKGTKCGPKSHNLQYRPTIISKLPPQTIPTCRGLLHGVYNGHRQNFFRCFGPIRRPKWAPAQKLNLFTRWRDDVNLSMWKINIPNSPEWPTPEKSTCCKGPHRRAPNVAPGPIMCRGDLETWESNN